MSLPTTDELKELRDQITSGPWYYDEDEGEMLGALHMSSSGLLTQPIVMHCGADHWDSKLIALAPELLDEVIRRRGEAGE